MNEDKLNKFAKIIIYNIIDQEIEECDTNLSFTNLDNPITKRWYEAVQKGDFKEFAKNIIADAVDSALFRVLHSVDYEKFDIIYRVTHLDRIDFNLCICNRVTVHHSSDNIFEDTLSEISSVKPVEIFL